MATLNPSTSVHKSKRSQKLWTSGPRRRSSPKKALNHGIVPRDHHMMAVLICQLSSFGRIYDASIIPLFLRARGRISQREQMHPYF